MRYKANIIIKGDSKMTLEKNRKIEGVNKITIVLRFISEDGAFVTTFS